MRNVDHITRKLLTSPKTVSDTCTLFQKRRWWESQEGERIEYFITPMVQSLAIRKHIDQAFKNGEKYDQKKRIWEEKRNRVKVVKTMMRKLESIKLGFHLIRENYDYALADFLIITHGLYNKPTYDVSLKMIMELKK